MGALRMSRLFIVTPDKEPKKQNRLCIHQSASENRDSLARESWLMNNWLSSASGLSDSVFSLSERLYSLGCATCHALWR